MQLFSIALAHPSPDIHGHFLDGSYQLHVAQLIDELCGQPAIFSECRTNFADFESQYIELFHVGNKGRPIVGLHSGDYNSLLGARPRPEFLLDFVSWYKHFGVNVRRDEKENELPDHITCQLEFVAWLAYLESTVEGQPELQNGYQRGQRDFLQGHSIPALNAIVQALQAESATRGKTSFFSELCSLALRVARQITADLEMAVGAVQPRRVSGHGNAAAVSMDRRS